MDKASRHVSNPDVELSQAAMAGRAALAHPSPVCLHGRGMRNSSHATNRAYAMSRASAVEESTQAESLDSLDDDEDDVSMSESMEAPLSIDTEDRDSVESARRRRRRRSRRSGHRVRSASTAGYRMASRKNRPRGAELRRVKRSMESAAGTGRRQSGSANTHGWKVSCLLELIEIARDGFLTPFVTFALTFLCHLIALQKDTLEIAAALGLDMGQAEMEGEVNNSLAEVTGSLAHFVNDIRATDVLTYEQERELTNYVTEYHHVERMREELEYNTKRAPSDSELATYSGKEEEDIKQTVFEGKLAKRLMVEYNLGLVVSMAKKFMHRGLQLDDLIQEGTFGLLKAIDRYDPDRGFKFSTYCFWWIRQALQKAIMGHTRTIRVPSGVYWNASQVLSAERRLTCVPSHFWARAAFPFFSPAIQACLT